MRGKRSRHLCGVVVCKLFLQLKKKDNKAGFDS
jgi:hypothetical protein